MYAIQGAMAIRRERQRREQKRSSQIKRTSTKNSRGGSQSPRPSECSVNIPQPPPKTESSLTAFHLGVVFILLGFLMVFSSMVSNSVVEADWSHLLGVGVTFIIVGLIMVMVNRIITAREEEELARYVSGRLSRTRSGHALVRDLEPGESRPVRVFSTNGQRRAGTAGAGCGGTSPRSPKDKLGNFDKIQRGGSTRRSAREHKTEAVVDVLPTKSSSTHSHLAVQNGKAHVERTMSDAPNYQGAAAGARANPSAVVADVVTTETETLLPKGDNQPAVTVTKQTRKPSTKTKPTEAQAAQKS